MPTIIFRTVSGNVIGVVEKPDAINPEKPITEQYMVKIGVLDRSGPLPRKNADKVICKLLEFVKTL
jgi:hypothetical protein